MLTTRFFLALAILWAPAAGLGAVGAGDLPADAKWYVHVDLAAMRESVAGRQVYAWFKAEALDEIRDEIGIDPDQEADRVTAFAVGATALTVIVEGDISQASRDKLLALGAASGTMDRLETGGSTYYHVKAADGDEASVASAYAEHDFEPFSEGAYFSFAAKDRLIVTATEADMQALLAAGGRVRGSAGGELLVLGADQSLLQAGLEPAAFGDEIGWDSNVVRNTRQVALAIADREGMLAVTARLLASEASMAESLASIVRGLISLQVFNNDLDPELSKVLQNTTVAVTDAALTVSVLLDPALVVEALE